MKNFADFVAEEADKYDPTPKVIEVNDHRMDTHHPDKPITMDAGRHYTGFYGPTASKYKVYHHYSKQDPKTQKFVNKTIVAIHNASNHLGAKQGFIKAIKGTKEHKDLAEKGFNHKGHTSVSHPDSPPESMSAATSYRDLKKETEV
jgi:hypothetical protein